MVGSGGAAGGGGDHARSKEAAGMMALHEALRNVCLTSDWTYSVFWTIRPRPYVLLRHVLLSFASFLLLPTPSFDHATKLHTASDFIFS
jgi:hypothetical protein